MLDFPTMTALNLRGNDISVLPPAISQMVALQSLDLRDNYHLKELSYEIGIMTRRV